MFWVPGVVNESLFFDQGYEFFYVEVLHVNARHFWDRYGIVVNGVELIARNQFAQNVVLRLTTN